MKTTIKTTLISFLLFVASSRIARAFEVPNFAPNVVDEAQVLSATEVQQLNDKIEQVRNQSHVFAAILTVRTLDGLDIETAANKVFEKWQLGQSKVDNGILFLVATGDRKTRIEVGYGLEGSVTDAHAKQIIDNVFLPKFKKSEYFEGLLKGLDVVNTLALKGDPIELKPQPLITSEVKALALIWLLLILVVPFILRTLLVRRAANYPAELQPTAKEKSPLFLFFGQAWFVTLFLIVNPGVFFIVVPIATGSYSIALFFAGLGYLFLGATNTNYWSMRNVVAREASYRKRISLAKSTTDSFSGSVWDRNFTTGGMRSSGGSGSSSSRSSSGGGSSGGGGASGSW